MKGVPEAFLTLKNNAFLLSKFDFLCKSHIELMERKCPKKERYLLLLEFVRMEMIFLNIFFSAVKGPHIFFQCYEDKNCSCCILAGSETQEKGIVSCNYTVAKETVYIS